MAALKSLETGLLRQDLFKYEDDNCDKQAPNC
jgi:hypothetical protein